MARGPPGAPDPDWRSRAAGGTDRCERPPHGLEPVIVPAAGPLEALICHNVLQLKLPERPATAEHLHDLRVARANPADQRQLDDDMEISLDKSASLMACTSANENA